MTPDHGTAVNSRLLQSSERLRQEISPALLSEFPIVVGRVYGNSAVPSTPNVFISVNPVDVSGTEVEGGSGILTLNGGNTIVAFLVGSKPVIAGDFVICRFLGNRWVAEKLGRAPNGVALPGCPCASVPTTLTMTSSKPESNTHIFQNATLTYGPVPASLAALTLGNQAYLSTSQFTDFVTNDKFWYYFGCYVGFYVITRVYAKSQYGSPYRDQIRYRWVAGSLGNTCKPFLLNKGGIFAGGDASCIVTISG